MSTDLLRLRVVGCVCGVYDDDTRTNDVAYLDVAYLG